MNILLTGGLGYIGSHTLIELYKAGHTAVVVDNLSNSQIEVLEKLQSIVSAKIPFVKEDVCDYSAMEKVFNTYNIDGIIHFAALKAVGESMEKPTEYYSNNLVGTLTLMQLMKKYGVKNFIFSSSATVYGDPHSLPIYENFPLSATNPYGRTKLFIEQMLTDFYNADNSFNIVLLRYFNPIGAHPSGLIGEDPKGVPNNLMPYIMRVASKKLPHLNVFGNNYKTIDGSGVRDYIHVVDLAKGHVCGMKKWANGSGLSIYNLGTGKGTSVFQLISAFEKASGINIPYKITSRRSGDIAECYADASLAKKELGWQAELSVEEMCFDSWNYAKNHK